MQIEVVRGAAAQSLLVDARFCAGWSDLLERCRWASGFQSPGYVSAWFQNYHARYEPILLLSTDGAGRPTGLMALAASKADGEIDVAGGLQAEYSSWLCAGESANAFPAAALGALPDLLGSRALRIG